ncbi:MAG: metal-dependent transcriptional regulator [Cytophagia bacterium]|nr:MAG: metal-dependent transcriptional regulator [Runella sp.]TAG21436.1 MAG: metal-dependent transcriptional regulator [Cytophagales bacterium]TAG40741.1 MAG: metal-dependent transcriptional regulator [Cytophagia bacterium]TAG51230.1 MAG: metal-dependent transcriptional regulator [Runella slithyformis]TAG68309.1 MAG: metal-dependent transcriptional regulator [Runella slithyformis]
MQTFTEENYLKTIHVLSVSPDEWVTTNALADSTMTRAASVSDMLKRLAEKGLIHYQKYQGVRLTQEGERLALKIIRKHRLWEVFLVEKLQFGWDEVHVIAEELEHIKSERLVEKLDAFLAFPQFDPHGDPIPDAEGNMPPVLYQKLSEIALGQTVIMTGVSEHAPAFLQHLAKLGIALGCQLNVQEINAFDKSITLQINNSPPLFVSHEVAKNLWVKP